MTQEFDFSTQRAELERTMAYARVIAAGFGACTEMPAVLDGGLMILPAGAEFGG